MSSAVVVCGPHHLDALKKLLQPYRLQLRLIADGDDIPGSYWGSPEAGLIGNRLLVRSDTPLHSALHEACHWICMGAERRAQLHTDAGGDDAEENAVCYLQAVLADRLPGYSQTQLFSDMDDWGYSFRLGSAQRWFTADAEDAPSWLQHHGIVDSLMRPTGLLRQHQRNGLSI